jgi:hypothetical protein
MATYFLFRLLKNARLLRCAACLVNRHTLVYASFLGSCAPCIRAFLNSLLKALTYFQWAVEKHPSAACHLQVTFRRKPRVEASFPLFITFR